MTDKKIHFPKRVKIYQISILIHFLTPGYGAILPVFLPFFKFGVVNLFPLKIVEHLIFGRNFRNTPIPFLYVMEHTAIATFGNFHFPSQFKIIELLRGVDDEDISSPSCYSYRQLVKSAPSGALSAIRFIILGTYIVL